MSGYCSGCGWWHHLLDLLTGWCADCTEKWHREIAARGKAAA